MLSFFSYKKEWIIVILLQFLCMNCGDSETGITSTLLNYSLESSATNGPVNKLIFNYPSGSDYQIQITSDSVFGSFENGEVFSMPSELELYTDGYGEYKIGLTVTQSDGTIFVDDKLTWEYFDIDPDDPIVSFNKKATNNDDVQLLISTSRGPKTNEIWVEGDLLESDQPSGYWRVIPESDQVALKLTEGDGLYLILFIGSSTKLTIGQKQQRRSIAL